ncbi:MAG: ATP-binding protein [Thermoproteota archaeon]|nr:ATP-binding protein [Thermoproteota archaeon]
MFNREEELEKFYDALKYASLIVIIGPRRTGKTSFMNVALVESKHPHISLDMRGLPYNPSRVEIIRRLENAFNLIEKKWFSALSETLRHVKGVSIVGSTINFEWSRTGIDLADLFDRIDNWASKQNKRFLIAFDEIQLIRGDKSIPRLFAHVADTNHNITIVVTGSEFGLLFDFLGFENPNSPLYGRHYTEIFMRNFDFNESKAFLMEGFRQVKIKTIEEAIDYAVQKLDGVAGWLTLFGVRCRDKNKCSKKIVDEVVVEGGKLARAETLKLTKLSRRYGMILNFLATVSAASWTQIKTTLEIKEKRSLPNPRIANLLNTLVKMSVIKKTNNGYAIADSILLSGIKQDSLPE